MLKNNYIVYGRVQGVGFRRFVLRCAEECSIGGWVKNLPNGNVQIEAIGNSTELKCFVEKISQGSWFSDVEEVELTDTEEISESHEKFEIVR